MTLPFFPNESMDIYSVHNDEYDEFGRKNEYVYKETVAIDMQPYSPESSMQRFGKILQDTYTVIFDENIEVTDTDKLLINNIYYEIIGSVENWNHVLPHKQMLIKRLRK